MLAKKSSGITCWVIRVLYDTTYLEHDQDRTTDELFLTSLCALRATPLPILPIQCATLLKPCDIRSRIIQILLQHLDSMLPEQRRLEFR